MVTDHAYTMGVVCSKRTLIFMAVLVIFKFASKFNF